MEASMTKNNASWDLDAIYRGFDDPAWKAAVRESRAAFDGLREDLSAGEETLPAEGLASLLARYDEAALRFSTPETFLTLWDSVRPADAAYALAEKEIREIAGRRDAAFILLEQRLAAYAASLGEAEVPEVLASYRFLIEESRRMAPHRPDPAQLDLLHALRKNGEDGWYALRNDLDAAASVTLCLDGEEKVLPLSEVRGLAASPDPVLREAAYRAELASYPAWEVPMAACMNGIKGEALEELPYKHYDSLREEMLDVNRMRGETLDALHASIRDHLPALRRYLKAKARLLGHTGGLPWYDLEAPVGGEQRALPLAEARALVEEILAGFSPELGELARRAFDGSWIDAMPAPGKRSGGVCFDLPALRENRILVNYGGSLQSARTIAHELGHAYHNRCLDRIPMILRDAPTPICETASTMNETLFAEGCLARNAGDRLSLLDADLSGTVQVVMDVYSRYLFEDRVLALRAKRRLLPEDLCRLMTDAQKEVFGDAVDPAFLHPYLWMPKVHYYIPQYHYYNYPYYFGLLFSKGLYSMYKKDPEGFPARYRDLLAATGTNRLEEIAAIAGADITTQAFWDSAFESIEARAEEFCRLAKA